MTAEELVTRHADLFKDELGTVTTFLAELHVKPDAVPKFCKARPVPVAIKSGIEAELQQLESASIISKVAHSKWAAPIVPVPKRDGRFRICGVYKVTVNQALDVDQYLLTNTSCQKQKICLQTSLVGKKLSY